METEIRVVFSSGAVDSIEVTEKKPTQKKSAEAELRKILEPLLKERQKRCH